jgi:hypothetical protein
MSRVMLSGIIGVAGAGGILVAFILAAAIRFMIIDPANAIRRLKEAVPKGTWLLVKIVYAVLPVLFLVTLGILEKQGAPYKIQGIVVYSFMGLLVLPLPVVVVYLVSVHKFKMGASGKSSSQYDLASNSRDESERAVKAIKPSEKRDHRHNEGREE